MGTRADFYIGKFHRFAIVEHDWLGSLGWDGYPQELGQEHGISQEILRKKKRHTFKAAVEKLLRGRDDATWPKDGWPWPWETSHLTDYVYLFDTERNEVLIFCFSKGPVTLTELNRDTRAYKKYKAAKARWLTHREKHPDSNRPEPQEPGETFCRRCFFPDMSKIQKVTLGPRSGLIVI